MILYLLGILKPARGSKIPRSKRCGSTNEGFTGQTGGDGQSLFSTAHPLVNGGTNGNRPSTAVDLNETSLEAAVIAIGKYTDERGKNRSKTCKFINTAGFTVCRRETKMTVVLVQPTAI